MEQRLVIEAELDHAFADALQASPAMQDWLLAGGRFGRFSGKARLLVSEQAVARRGAKHWWKHWWCKLPDGRDSETDIFLIFEADGQRFAIHIEDKPLHGKLTLEQATGYRRRAAFMANKARWLDYGDFETVVIAPATFLEANAVCVGQFDRALAYEEIAAFVPLFAQVSTGMVETEASELKTR